MIRDLKADLAQSWEDYEMDETRKQIYKQLSDYKIFYQINRTGVDKSTYAALMAAQSIIEGNKARFMNFTKPDEDSPWIKFN